MKAFKNSLLYILIFLVPKNVVSHLMGALVSIKLPPSWAVFINRFFARAVGVNTAEAEYPIEAYKSLQDFFIRRLKDGLRPIASEESAIVSPCDGLLCEAGTIEKGQLVQLKGRYYSVHDLLDDALLAERFEGGIFATIYLSPRDYHRFHAPLSGSIDKTIYIPGSLWPVNPWAVAHIKNLFCINERIISLIIPEGQKKMIAQIAVGATMVGKIKLNHCDLESNEWKNKAIINHQEQKAVYLKKGEELGTFMFGSTIIMLFEPGLINDLSIKKPAVVKVGEKIALMNP